MPFATVNDHNLHYTDTPPTSNTTPKLTLILVHGLGSTQNYYFPILPYLSVYRVITFDNYGAGRSKYVAGTETSVASIAKDVLGLLDHLGVERAVVGGYSMGGMVVNWLAGNGAEQGGKGRERVVAGVCIGPVHPSEQAAAIFKKRIETVREGGIETMANTVPFAAPGKKATQLQRSFIREMIMGQDPEGYCANCRAIETATPPDYQKVECPILIIAGEEDKSAPLEGCQKIHDSLKSKQKDLQVLQGVGHWHCVEDPEQVGGLIKKFCDDVAKQV